MDRSPKAILHSYLTMARDAVVWKLDEVSEYDARRPLTPTGTNLLGIVKHLATVELGYFGDTFDRPHDVTLPWDGREEMPNEDMFATADETRDDILDLDDTGTVAWWPDDVNPVTLHWILVHMIAETNRHGGHADILRERIDGTAGLRPGGDNLPDGDAAWWSSHVEQIEKAARDAAATPELDT